MKHIKQALLQVFEKKQKTQDVLDCFSSGLRLCAETCSPHAAGVALHAQPSSYRNEVLLLLVPQELHTPEIQYCAEELRLALAAETKKRISRIRFSVQQS